MGKAQIVQNLRNPALAIVNPEALLDDRLQVNPAPANHAIAVHVGTRLNNPGKLAQLVIVQSAGGAAPPAVNQSRRPIGIESQHPVAKCLAVHAADPRRLRPVHAVINRRQRQQSPALIGIGTTTRKTPQCLAVKIASQS